MKPKIVLKREDYGWVFQIIVKMSDVVGGSDLRYLSQVQQAKIIKAFISQHRELNAPYVVGDEVVFEGKHVHEDAKVAYLTKIANSVVDLLYDAREKYVDFKRKVEAVTIEK